ncbi:major capsid protein [Mycobacterium phage Ogopogo]|uniref:Major capsid protein n=1 Tax=Mycobacterium phage Ogopogo TaxID=2099640 RepID=A0ACD6B918_9CAUD|nr:Chain A, Major capsid protein [Mycobacterium phage Ogopogo]8ECN_B Chain B, Major capsid protein [Mycobacterium phage Ogopogo]8ECN_C Chain C, Major capsid protein [Mycobacterium phage Ogopogo]8ECN_D Chain D, Major capsid protein [Mycobacterium phage Ogopogo]8ECN_E Chain E, Major capsid protein [Mycobacterium phage Ogopogo]8ECN_F Chain F, Major capsid protein [Mycobacterium phage Ogopogo]8ECN_G Chain G, Major capsid protein [Mycobacterium phage Ogopogo]8ECN_H Chain H, Major capsid protein [
MAVLKTSSFQLPRHLVPGVWQKAQGQSVLARLSNAEPQEFGEQQYMTLTAPPRGEVVGESAEKSESTATFAPVTSLVRKVQVTQRFSQEVKWADESRQLGVLQTMADLSGVALGRALDLIGIHGINPLTGAALAGTPPKIIDTTNVVELTTETLGLPDQAIEAAVGLVLDDSISPNGLALDNSFAFKLATQRHPTTGQKLYPELGFGTDISGFMSLGAAVSDTVRGGPEAVTPSTGAYRTTNPNIKAVVGDFSAFRWGVQANIPLTLIEYGDPDGSGDLQRKNELAIRAEVVYGVGILSTDAFAVVRDADES